MRRGGYGKPWRRPADGWAVPPKAYLGGLYQHRNDTLNDLVAFRNTTQVTLQPGEVGSPLTRYTARAGGSVCEVHPDNGLPPLPWIGPGSEQFATPPANTFVAQGTVDFGAGCRKRGGKWVQAVRQWHGAYGFNSHDPSGGPDTLCTTTVDGVTTYRNYESYQAAPDQTKYTAVSATCTLSQAIKRTTTLEASYLDGRHYNTAVTTEAWTGTKTAAQAMAVDPNSGLLELISHSAADSLAYAYQLADPIYGDAGPTTVADGGIMSFPGLNPDYCVRNWTANCGGVSFGGAPIPGVGPGTGWSGNATTLAAAIAAYNASSPGGGVFILSLTTYTLSATVLEIVLTLSPPATIVTTGTGGYPVHGTPLVNYTNTIAYGGSATWTLTVTLAGPNTAGAVYTDVQGLLAAWDLTNDAQYPPRTDGVWQIAPRMSRDEAHGNISPVTFPPPLVDDYRSPVNDGRGNAPFTTPENPPPPGWTYRPNNNDASGNADGSPGYGGPAAWVPTYSQISWFDPNAWGFTFPDGYDQSNSAAMALVQFGLTGAVLGAPNPAGYQNYFDFRAEVWRSCQYSAGGGTYLDWYLQGYGQWLQDVIDETGAQLPLNATQWTNYFDAFSKPAFAYLIQGDAQVYAGPPATLAHHNDAVWAQKCVIFPELWPSYNFFRPAGADRFAYDETAGNVGCVSGLTSPTTGGTFTITDYTGTPITLSPPSGSVWGGFSVGGFYHITVSGSTVTLGALVLALPATWASASGDTATVFGRLRNPTAPAILGRDAVSAVTDNHDGTVTLTLAAAENWLLTGDKIDLLSSNITYDGNGNRVSEAMTSLAANLTATVVDSTHVKVTAAYGTIGGTQYIMSQGAPDWSWDDNGRKGDWVCLDWTFDYRTNGEAARLATVTDCAGNTPPAAGVPAMNYGYAGFTQTQYEHTTGLAFKPCCAMALCISPNGETFTNGTTVPFPSVFNFDGRYGARWQAELEEAMVDLLWQSPHIPCGSDGTWRPDDGTCTLEFAHPPLVEARSRVPNYGGNSESLTAPTPPTGIGYRSPVTDADGLGAPGQIGFDPNSGLPTPAWTLWGYREAIEATCGSCRFNYMEAENLPCVRSYAPAVTAGVPNLNTNTGNTGDGLT